MACLTKGCTIESDYERMICCWLCHELCHFKCSGLTATVAESISKYKGLHWCCPNCRQIGVSFYRFFKGTKDNFLEIQNEASQLSERIAVYGKLFDDFKSLDTLKSPPQSSPKRRKSNRKNKDKPDDSALSTNSLIPFTKTPSLNNPSTSITPFNSPSTSITPGISLTSSVKIPSNTNPTITASNIIDKPINNPEVPLNYAQVLTSTALPPNITESTSIPDDNVIVHRELRAIPRPKSIFISRLASETTIEDINYYITTKLNSNAEISTYKFSYAQPRSIASFKITVSAEMYVKLIDPCFWPDNTLVREYRYKENQRNNNITRLPSTSGQKN